MEVAVTMEVAVSKPEEHTLRSRAERAPVHSTYSRTLG